MTHPDSALALLRCEVTPALYHRIRELWKAHSIAEDRRDIAGLLDTLTPDCQYELPQLGQVWQGHEGATRFYRGLLTAFPDIKFELRSIVIGPQGVCEEAEASGTHRGDWLDLRASGRAVRFDVIIFFPWDEPAGKFRGERVFVDLDALRV